MNHRASHAILAATLLTALVFLAGEATSPLLYTAANTSTALHVDPATVPKLSGRDADALIPLMGVLLSETGTLTLNIKLKDYESAERDLARYAELSSRFDKLVINLDVSGTDIGEFQRNNRENFVALAALLNDTRRLEGLQRVEVQVQGDGDRHAAVIYEGEALQQKLQGGITTYAGRENAMIQIAGRYGVNATPYRESVRNYADIAGATEEMEAESRTNPPSPLSIAVTPNMGRYGDTLSIIGAYTSGTPGTPIEIYVDSQIAGNATLDANGTYTSTYRIDHVPAGLHLAYAVAGAIYSNVAAFEVGMDGTALTLILGEDRTTVACTGCLMTAGDRLVTFAPVLLRVDGSTPVETWTDENGTYLADLTLPAGEHTIRAEFNTVGYPLNASESPTETIIVRNEGLSPLPLVAAIAAALGSGWYLRRRHRRRPEEKAPVPEPEERRETETIITPSQVDIAGLPPREAATVLFLALRDQLGLPGTNTPRDCARLIPAHAGFFEHYEQIRYAGKTPSEEELRAMKEEVLGGEEHAT